MKDKEKSVVKINKPKDTEFRRVIVESLEIRNELTPQLNLESATTRELLAKEIEDSLKKKFLIFRINKLIAPMSKKDIAGYTGSC